MNETFTKPTIEDATTVLIGLLTDAQHTETRLKTILAHWRKLDPEQRRQTSLIAPNLADAINRIDTHYR